MFKSLRVMFQPSLWKQSSVHQRNSYYAVEFGALAMVDCVLFMAILRESGLPPLIDLLLSLSFLVVLFSIVLDWFWDWSERLSVMEG